MSAPPPVFVVGRFPPPPDGQSLATARSADLLAETRDVRRVNTEPPGPLLHHPDPHFSLGRTLFFARLGRRLRLALAAHPEAPVVWHAASPSALGHLRDVATTLPAFGPSRPVYAVLHRGTVHRLFERAATRPTARRLARRVTAFVCQSEALAGRLAPWVPEPKRRVIPHTVDAALAVGAAEAAARIGEGPGRPLRLLYLSNMIREKGYLDVLEAAGRLRAQGVPVRLDLAGYWSADADRQSFEARVAALGLAAAVRHHGGLADRDEARRLHLAADVFLLPTAHPSETQPIALLEALGAGSAVVTADRDVLRDLGGPGALYVPAHDPAALADAVAPLADAARWRTAAAAARARYEAAFAPERVRDAWAALVAG